MTSLGIEGGACPAQCGRTGGDLFGKEGSDPMKTRMKLGMVATASAIAMLATVADARHQWRKYEWAYDGAEIDAPVIDNTSGGGWSTRVAKAVNDWNESSRIEAGVPVPKGTNTNCTFILGQIHVCNGDYGSTGWLGIASISINGNEIIAGYTKLNDYYFNQPSYNTEDWKQLVTCQEIGHDYGLAHQNENFMTDATTSCMEYTSWPEGNTTPDQHDYDQLEAMYTVGDGTTGGGGKGGKPGGKPAKLPSVGNTPDSWGNPIEFLPNGKPHVYERQFNGYRVITHVTWTIEAAAEQGDYYEPGPRQHSGDRHFDF